MTDVIVPIRWSETSDPSAPIADMSFSMGFQGSTTIKLLGSLPNSQGRPISPRFVSVLVIRACIMTIDGVPYSFTGAEGTQSFGLPDNVLTVRFDSIGFPGPGPVTCIFMMKSTFQAYLL